MSVGRADQTLAGAFLIGLACKNELYDLRAEPVQNLLG